MATAPAAGPKASAPSSEEDGSHSGRLLLRMPPALHSQLARAAEREGSSLNAYITRILSDTAGRRSRRSTQSSGSRLLRIALIADFALVAVAATVAIALLITAWP